MARQIEMETLSFYAVPRYADAIGMECRWWKQKSLPEGAPGGLKLYPSKDDAVFAWVMQRRLHEYGLYAPEPKSGILHYPYDGGAWGFYTEEVKPLVYLLARSDALNLGWTRSRAETMLWQLFARAATEGLTDEDYDVRVWARPPIAELSSPANYGLAEDGITVVLMDCGPRTLQGWIAYGPEAAAGRGTL